jgi:hypothetical protein
MVVDIDGRRESRGQDTESFRAIDQRSVRAWAYWVARAFIDLQQRHGRVSPPGNPKRPSVLRQRQPAYCATAPLLCAETSGWRWTLSVTNDDAGTSGRTILAFRSRRDRWVLQGMV